MLFWGWSEFFGSHNSPILSNVFFFGFVSSVLVAIACFAFKHWPHLIIICLFCIILCGFSGWVIYQYANPSKPGSASLANPTTEGYKTFAASTDDLINQIRIQSTNGNGKMFGQPITDYLANVEANLNEIRLHLPEAEWHIIDDRLKVLQKITDQPINVNTS